MTTELEPRWTFTAGDVKNTLVARVGGVDDLSTATGAVGWVRRESHAWVSLAAEVLDAGERTILVHLGDAGGWLPEAAYTRADGLDELYDLKVRVSFADGSTHTFPEDDAGRLTIEAGPGS